MSNEDIHQLYNTCLEMVKHFNSILDKVRIIVITVGIGIFVAFGKLYINGNTDKWIYILISVWGMFFVIFMWFLAYHYLTHTESCAATAREIETKLLKDYELDKGAFQSINEDHQKIFCGNKLAKFILDFSTFFVMAIGFIVLLIVSLKI